MRPARYFSIIQLSNARVPFSPGGGGKSADNLPPVRGRRHAGRDGVVKKRLPYPRDLCYNIGSNML